MSTHSPAAVCTGGDALRSYVSPTLRCFFLFFGRGSGHGKLAKRAHQKALKKAELTTLPSPRDMPWGTARTADTAQAAPSDRGGGECKLRLQKMRCKKMQINANKCKKMPKKMQYVSMCTTALLATFDRKDRAAVASLYAFSSSSTALWFLHLLHGFLLLFVRRSVEMLVSDSLPCDRLASDMHSTTCSHLELQKYQKDTAVPSMLAWFWPHNSVSPFSFQVLQVLPNQVHCRPHHQSAQGYRQHQQ